MRYLLLALLALGACVARPQHTIEGVTERDRRECAREAREVFAAQDRAGGAEDSGVIVTQTKLDKYEVHCLKARAEKNANEQ